VPIEHPHQRGRFRIEYPRQDRPALVLVDQTLEVVDCSESGFRYVLPSGEPVPEIGSEVHGLLRFRGGKELKVEGVVTRLFGPTVAVHLTDAEIPFSVILREQQSLRRRYPY
jgi:hypothetical protein